MGEAVDRMQAKIQKMWNGKENERLTPEEVTKFSIT
jgi:hypothetical protein